MPTSRSSEISPLARWLEHALDKPGAWLDHPWGEDHDVVKVGERMFVLAGSAQDEPSFSVKHEDMDSRSVWRARCPEALEPTPYMANKPWSRVFPGRAIDSDDVRELIDESYLAVVRRLAKKHRPDGWDADLDESVGS